MKSKKHLNFGSLRSFLSKVLNELPDSREINKTSFEIHDVLMSGFACMYFQDPSLVQFQKRLEDDQERGKHLEQYQIFPGQYLCAIDGTVDHQH